MSNLPERAVNNDAPEDGGAEPCYRCKQERGDHEWVDDDEAEGWFCQDGREFLPYPDEDDLRDAAREGRWD